MGPRVPRNGLMPAPFEARALASLGPGPIALGFVFCLPPISQGLDNHRFAHDRTTCGGLNSPKVASDFSFLLVGSLGRELPVRPGAGGTSGPVLALFRPSQFNSPGRVTGDAPE
jgi:hypothetical protein